ncbi:hypothetical protein Pcinc_016808 [Petrolisthes cinctipes]|uniref:Uncharacterized protein n=1 Tax=Petrolisthes cinctipes TaxID=88211 RepID=A0AAE1FQD2_PETCI|nr:hypothetical protein Pcinc_016808 [Petrolisthes cinctipes]
MLSVWTGYGKQPQIKDSVFRMEVGAIPMAFEGKLQASCEPYDPWTQAFKTPPPPPPPPPPTHLHLIHYPLSSNTDRLDGENPRTSQLFCVTRGGGIVHQARQTKQGGREKTINTGICFLT